MQTNEQIMVRLQWYFTYKVSHANTIFVWVSHIVSFTCICNLKRQLWHWYMYQKRVEAISWCMSCSFCTHKKGRATIVTSLSPPSPLKQLHRCQLHINSQWCVFMSKLFSWQHSRSDLSLPLSWIFPFLKSSLHPVFSSFPCKDLVWKEVEWIWHSKSMFLWMWRWKSKFAQPILVRVHCTDISQLPISGEKK